MTYQDLFMTSLSHAHPRIFFTLIPTVRPKNASASPLTLSEISVMRERALADSCKMQQNHLKSIDKDELIDAIISAENVDAVAMARAEIQLNNVVKEMSGIRKCGTTSENQVSRRLAEMHESRQTSQTTIVL